MPCYRSHGVDFRYFAQRARTHEGKLQVELAQLRHLATRLVRGWTHLERQKAGLVCAVRGNPARNRPPFAARPYYPDLSRLERVEKQREQGRRARTKADIPTVSLVGYTNAGKSTLFNQITEARSMPQTSCLRPTQRCVVSTWRMWVKPCWRIP